MLLLPANQVQLGSNENYFSWQAESESWRLIFFTTLAGRLSFTALTHRSVADIKTGQKKRENLSGTLSLYIFKVIKKLEPSAIHLGPNQWPPAWSFLVSIRKNHEYLFLN